MNPTAGQSQGENFRQSELDKFGALAQRWRGEQARSRSTASRATERLRMDAQAGTMRHGRLGASS